MESTAQAAKNLFTNRDLARLMVPLVIEQLLLMTVGMADTMMETTAGEAVVSMRSMWTCRIGMSYLLGPAQGLGMGLLGSGWPCSATGWSGPPCF